MNYSYHFLSGSELNPLSSFSVPLQAAGILQALADRTPDGRVRRMAEEAIQRVHKNAGQDQSVKKLQQDLDQLKKDNQDLKSRLESLEAKTSTQSAS